MIRVVIYLLIVAAVAAGEAWLADQPGSVTITWLGYETNIPVWVAANALLAAIIVGMVILSILRALWRSPDFISMLLRDRRGIRGYQAISRGLVAIGAGDADAARKYARAANRVAPGDALVLLL